LTKAMALIARLIKAPATAIPKNFNARGVGSWKKRCQMKMTAKTKIESVAIL